MPSFQLATSFLGLPCGSGFTEGVNPELRWRLHAAEDTVRAAFDALAPEQRIDPATGRARATFSQWVAVRGPHECWRPHAGHHSAGAAIDVNAATNPYIVTRNAGVPGGQAGGEGLVAMRMRFLAACDRAVRFVRGPHSEADLRPRQPNESTQSVWTRFKAASDAVVLYVSLALDARPSNVTRVALENADEISDGELLAAVSETERLPLRDALPRLEDVLGSAEFRESHPDWPNAAHAQYLRIVRDYEELRIPMVVGVPSATPALTRNPARGFLNLRCELVTALCDQGLRWGACDFTVRADGSSRNGAMMHFDLADNGGYPQIDSLLRFG
jgi:hypothetical protein